MKILTQFLWHVLNFSKRKSNTCLSLMCLHIFWKILFYDTIFLISSLIIKVLVQWYKICRILYQDCVGILHAACKFHLKDDNGISDFTIVVKTHPLHGQCCYSKGNQSYSLIPNPNPPLEGSHILLYPAELI